MDPTVESTQTVPVGCACDSAGGAGGSYPRLLSEASRALGASIDYQETLATIARLVVPEFADGIVIYVVGPGGEPEHRGATHKEPSTSLVIQEYFRRYSPDQGAFAGVSRVLASGEPELSPHVPVAMLSSFARDEEEFRLLEQIGFHSQIIAFLCAHEESVGALVFGRGSERTGYTDGDLGFAREFAERAGLAIRNARLYAAAQRELVERRQAEETLGPERELLQQIIDAIPVMITLYEPDTHVLRLNREFERQTGWTTEAARRVDLMAECYPDPESRERCRDDMQSLEPGWRDIRMVTRDGRVIETAWANVRLFDDTRVGIGLEIGDRKRAEAALHEADRRKDDFLAMLAHELRNPLAPIKNAIELLQRIGSKDPRVVRASEIIERQVTHQARLLDDLLDVSRIVRGKVEIRAEPLDFVNLVCDAVEDRRSILEAAGLVLDLLLPQGALTVQGDRIRLAQVVGNLLQNAAAFGSPGGAVTVRVGRDGEQAALSIQDTGDGIAPELLPHVFEPFVQGDQSIERSRGGLGLGLALVRGLVQLHGGEVTASSDGPGRGATFTVRLPLIDAPAASRPAPARPISDRRPARVLIVEDHEDTARTIRDLLELCGHTVAEAHSGPEALALAREFRPDVVLCDLGLPGMDGFQVARTLREDPATRSARLIAISGYGGADDQRRSLAAGFERHLTKPLDFSLLESLISPREARGSA